MSGMRLVAPVEVSLWHHAHRLDRVRLVFLQLRFHRRRIGAAAPIGCDQLHLQAELARHFLPQAGEMPVSTIAACLRVKSS